MASLQLSQLSALSSAVDEMAQRVAELAAGLEGGGSSDAVTALFEAERSLVMSGRSLDRARRALV